MVGCRREERRSQTHPYVAGHEGRALDASVLEGAPRRGAGHAGAMRLPRGIPDLGTLRMVFLGFVGFLGFIGFIGFIEFIGFIGSRIIGFIGFIGFRT